MRSLSDRTISGFPLSIGTSLAFESIFKPILTPYDPERPIPNKINITDYQQIWINISTLFRNLVGSIDKDLFIKTKPQEFADTLYQEIDIIKSLLINEGMNICKPIFYIPNYNSIYTKLHKAVQLRKNNTENKLLYQSKYKDTIKVLNNQYLDELLNIDHKLKPKSLTNALIITHIPYDLLSYVYFKNLSLVESHTGVLKTRELWYTKYFQLPKADMSILPFNRRLLKIFGDHVMFAPLDIRLRREIYSIAINRKWTSMTTDEKIIHDLDLSLKERSIYETILQF